jgi:hyperosmotically inducible periplasmic protein
MRYQTLALTLLVAVGGLSGCVAALVGGAAAGAYYVGKDERSADEIAEDAALTAEVKSRLIAERGVRSLSINVDSYKGVVYLKGDVKSAHQRALAERVARQAKGAARVQNDLIVK